MPFIDWSNAEALFDMLIEYVADEKSEAHGDPERGRFLANLLNQLKAAQNDPEDLPKLITKLKKIIDSVESDFEADPVIDHLTACLDELERIREEN